MVGIRSPDGLVVGSYTSHPGVLGSIPKREEPGKTGRHPVLKYLVPHGSQGSLCHTLVRDGQTSLRAVGQVKGWQTQQIVFVGGACGSVHVESFNKNMKAFGVLESKWNPIRQKLVRRLLEEQDKVLRSYFAQKGGTRGQRGGGTHGQGREHVKWDMYV